MWVVVGVCIDAGVAVGAATRAAAASGDQTSRCTQQSGQHGLRTADGRCRGRWCGARQCAAKSPAHAKERRSDSVHVGIMVSPNARL